MKINKNNILEMLFYVGIFLIQFAIFAQNTFNFSKYINILVLLAIAILFFDSILVLIKLRATRKSWLLVVLLISLSFCCYIKTGDSLLITLCLTSISALHLNFKKIIKRDIIFKIALFIFIYLAYSTGNVNKVHFIREGIIRIAYGFNHPNTLGYFLLSTYFEIVYLISQKMDLKKFLSIFLLSGVVFYFTDKAGSRTSIQCLVIFLVLFVIKYFIDKLRKLRKKKSKKTNIVLYMLFMFFTLISFYCTIMYKNNNDLMIRINDLLSDRLYLQSMFVSLYDINLLGNKIDYFSTLDNSYMRVVLNYGIFGWVLFCYIFNLNFKYSNKKENSSYLTIILFVLLIYGVMEFYIIRPALNIFLVYFATKILDEEKENENEEC